METPYERFRDRWIGTRYQSGARVRGGGVDCLELACAFFEFCRPDLPKLVLPQQRMDAPVSRPRDAEKTVLAFMRWGEGCRQVDGEIETGDILLVPSRSDLHSVENARHCAIAGRKPGVCLHASSEVGVVETSVESFGEYVRVLRPLKKELWRADG